MSDDLVKRLQQSTYDPVTGEILDLGAFAHISVSDVCSARSRLEQAAAALVAKDAENARLQGILAEITMMETGYANATVRRMARRANDAFTSPHKEETP